MAQYFSNALQNFGNQGTGLYDTLLGQNQQDAGANYQQMYGPNGLYNGLTSAIGYGNNGVQLSSAQQQAIMGGDGQGGLSGVNSYTSPLSQSQINGWSQGGNPGLTNEIQGYPGTVLNNAYANADTLGQNITQGNANVMGQTAMGQSGVLGAANAGQQMLTGAVDPSAFGLSPGYTSGINSALGAEGQGLSGAVNNPNLGLSQQFQQNYQFTPQDVQNMVSAAGTQVGNQFQSTEDTLQRQAMESGQTSPLAVAAANTRANIAGAAQAGDAMTAARNQAIQTQLGVTQAAEQMRLGTAQDISSRQMQAAEALGGSTLGALGQEQGYGLQGATAGQGLQLSALGQAANLGMTGQQYAANLGQGGSEFGAGQLNQGTEYATGSNLSAGEYANTNSQNAGQYLLNNMQNYGLASQGQQQQQAGALYGQQYNTNNALASRAGQVAQTGLNQSNLYSSQVAGMYNNANSNYNTVMGQQSNNLNARQNNGMNAYGQSYSTQGTPVWQQVLGGITGAAGAAGNIMKGMGSI